VAQYTVQFQALVLVVFNIISVVTNPLDLAMSGIFITW